MVSVVQKYLSITLFFLSCGSLLYAGGDNQKVLSLARMFLHVPTVYTNQTFALPKPSRVIIVEKPVESENVLKHINITERADQAVDSVKQMDDKWHKVIASAHLLQPFEDSYFDLEDYGFAENTGVEENMRLQPVSNNQNETNENQHPPVDELQTRQVASSYAHSFSPTLDAALIEDIIQAIQSNNLGWLRAKKSRGKLDVGYTDKNGDSLLHVAAQSSSAQMIEFLVKAGAEVSKPNRKGYTPLHIATITGRVEAIQMLVRMGAALEAREAEDGLTPFLCAAAADNPAALKQLAELGAHIPAVSSDGNNALEIAAMNGKFKSLRFLMYTLHFPIDGKNEDGKTILEVLHDLIIYGNLPLSEKLMLETSWEMLNEYAHILTLQAAK